MPFHAHGADIRIAILYRDSAKMLICFPLMQKSGPDTSTENLRFLVKTIQGVSIIMLLDQQEKQQWQNGLDTGLQVTATRFQTGLLRFIGNLSEWKENWATCTHNTYHYGCIKWTFLA